MTRLALTTLLCAALLSCRSAAPVLVAESPSPPEARKPKARSTVEQLVQQLGARSWKQREAASRLLEKMGRDAAAGLEAAGRSDNPEVRARARSILRRLPRLVLSSVKVIYRINTRPEGSSVTRTLQRVLYVPPVGADSGAVNGWDPSNLTFDFPGRYGVEGGGGWGYPVGEDHVDDLTSWGDTVKKQ